VEKIEREEVMTAVALDSSQTFNLKSALKYIIQYATNRTLNVADEEIFESAQKVRPMRYQWKPTKLISSRDLDI
jgi:hypothetical protein